MNPLAVRLSAECPKCGSDIVVRRRRADGNRFVSCVAYPDCRWAGDYDPALHALDDQLTELRDEIKRLRNRGAPDGVDLDRALRDVIRLAHPDKWPRATELATEVTKMLNALRERIK